MSAPVLTTPKSKTASRLIPLVVIGVTLALFAVVILLARDQLRRQIRTQIAGRDAEVLYALWQSQQAAAGAEINSEVPTENPADHLVSILETSRLRQMQQLRATRLFGAAGTFVIAFPEDVPDAALPPGALARLSTLRPVSVFHPALPETAVTLLGTEKKTVPALEVLLPLHANGQDRLLGVAQFILDGQSIADEFAALDGSLNRQSAAALGGVGLLLAIVLGGAFHRLESANRLLSQRTLSLQQANEELALAAKTAALGAVTAHLIHGLKNPLSGLQSFVTGRSGTGQEENQDWEAAVSSTRRMQSLINETVRVLREQSGAAAYELSIAELAELLSAKVAPQARMAGNHVRAQITGEAALTNRDANLVSLILENLLHNAIQATPAGRIVTLEIRGEDHAIVFAVRDEGPGLPEHVREQLFKPCQSTKEGGSGIGLAISKQLAASLGAELELRSSSAAGTTFVLRLPRASPLGTSATTVHSES